MTVKIRLSRRGAKKRPFYRIVVADVRAPRDGKFIEKVGTFDPLKDKMDKSRLNLEMDRIKHWLNTGAQPTEKVHRFLSDAGLMQAPRKRNNPNKAKPKKKAQERIKAKQEAIQKKKEEEKQDKDKQIDVSKEAKATEEQAAKPVEEAKATEEQAAKPAEEAKATEEQAAKPAEEAKAAEDSKDDK